MQKKNTNKRALACLVVFWFLVFLAFQFGSALLSWDEITANTTLTLLLINNVLHNCTFHSHKECCIFTKYHL